MFGWYKLKKFYPAGVNPSEWWDRKYEADGEQWDDPEEYRRQLFYPLLMEHLKAGNKYLDAGCGLGGWLAFLRARGMEVIGIESSKRAVEMALLLDPTLPIQVGDVQQLPYRDGEFDGYMAIGTWEYIEDGTERVAKEAKRVLKAGGMLFIEIPYANPFRRWTYLPLKSLEVFIRSRILGQRAMFSNHIFRKGDIRVLLEDLGFEVLAINPHDLPEEKSHYGLWIDWPFFRGKRPYELNGPGRLVKRSMNAISPWMIATGMFVAARKK